MEKIPGRSAISASSVGLINMESAINTGWIVISDVVELWACQKELAMTTIPISQPSSVICPKV